MTAPPAAYLVGSATQAAGAAPLAPYLMCQGNQAAGSSSIAVTVATSNSSGDCLLAWVTTNAGVTPTGVSDPVNGSWTQVGTGPRGGNEAQWFVMPNAGVISTSQQITATFNNTTASLTLQVFGCSGVVASSPVDVDVNTSGTSTAPSASSGTLAQASELVLAGLVSGNGGGSPTWSAPFAVLGTNQHNGTTQYGSVASDTVSATSSVTATATIVSAAWWVQLISIKAAAGGSNVVTVPVSNASSAGDCLVISCEANGFGVSTVTDTQGNQYTQRATATGPAQNVAAWTADYSNNPSGTRALSTTDTVSVTFAANTSVMLAGITGVQGLALAPADQASSANGTSASPSVTTGTLAQASEVVVSVLGSGNAGGAPSWGGSFAQTFVAHTGSSNYLSTAWEQVAASSAVTASATITSAGWAVIALSFKMFLPHSPTLPQVQVLAGFGAAPGSGLPGQWTDITPFVRSAQVTRQGTRLAGPLWQWQAGTCSIVLKNGDGRFDPDNLSGPYSSATKTVIQNFGYANIPSGGGQQEIVSSWTCPLNLVGTTIKCECWGGGGGAESGEAGSGNGGSGGGGGEYAAEPALAVTPGKTYVAGVNVGSGGSGGAGTFGTAGSAGSNGAATVFVGDSVSVSAGPGFGGGTPGGHGGSGSTNTVHFNGGNGATSTGNGGSGGGASGGSGGAGGAGVRATGNAGGAGGVPQFGGGAGGGGGKGGFSNAQAGSSGQGLAGGGGGGGNHTYNNFGLRGGDGLSGTITLTYQVTNAAGTFSLIAPGVPVMVQATFAGTTYPLFTGYADQWQDAGINNPHYAEVTLTATDAMEPLSLAYLPAQGSAVGAGSTTDQLITTVLNDISWPVNQRVIDPGDTVVQGSLLGDYAQNILQTIADTEAGSLYIDASGNVRFWHRGGILNDTRATTPQGVFGDKPGTSHSAGTELAYYQPARADDNTTLFNDVQNTRVGGTLQEAQDKASQNSYFLRSYQRSDLLQNSDSDALNWAQFVLFIGDSVEDRIDQLTIDPQRDITDLYPQALGREIGDRIEIWRRPPGVSAFSKDCYIRGITHIWDEVSWQTAWTTQDSTKYGSFWTLNDPVLGRLNFNALAY